VIGKKLREISVTGFEQDGKIATVDDMTARAHRFHSLDEIPEIGNHFWRAAGKIEDEDFAVREPIDYAVDGLACHNFLPLGSGIHVAMHAGEIAELPDIHLQHFGFGVTQR
jgi:hypothetical protein